MLTVYILQEITSLNPISVKTIIKAYASLAAGSSFWHVSETSDGHTCDFRVNDLIGYAGFNLAMRALNTTGSVLHELSDTPR